MALVIDASVTVRWASGGAPNALAVAALDRLEVDEAAVPAIWWFEIRNALIVNERHGVFDPAQTRVFLERVKRLQIRIDFEPDDSILLALVRQYGLSAYDAAYLELAVRLGCPLATLDKRLATAGGRAGVPLFAPESS